MIYFNCVVLLFNLFDTVENNILHDVTYWLCRYNLITVCYATLFTSTNIAQLFVHIASDL